MITLTKYGAKYNRLILNIELLSTETKPTTTYIEHDDNGTEVARWKIPNGSKLSEIDTGKEYKYDAANHHWYEVSTGGGGGGGTTNYTALSNKPQINDVTLTGNKTSADLGLQGALAQTQLGAVNSGVTANSVDVLEDILDSGEKNIIFNGCQSYTSGTFTCTVNANGSITLNGTVPNSMSFLFTNLFTGAKTIDGAYDNVLHFPQGNYRVAKSSRESDIYLQIIAYNTSSSVAALSLTDVGDGSKSFTVDNTYSYNFARIRIIAGKSFSNFTFMPFVCTEDAWLVSKTVTPYRPSTDELVTKINSKQNIIDSSHKLSADNVDDTSTTNKFVTASEKTDIGNTTAKVEGITSSTNNSITFGNGVTLYIGSTAPSSPNDGDYWLD